LRGLVNTMTRKIKEIIVELSEEDRLNNHTPDWVYKLCHDNNVFIRDLKTDSMIQILDLSNGKLED